MIQAEQFTNIVWCDLEIVMLKIHAYSDWDKKRINVCQKPRKRNPIVNVYICHENDSIFNSPQTYRENVMASGLYLGHHFGLPAKLKIIDENNIAFYHLDPGKIIWCFIIKYVLSLYANKENMLHLKGGAVSYKDKAFLILGRGGSGKTEVINALCKNGAKFMANTHLLVNRNYVCGIKTNIRVRKKSRDIYVPINGLENSILCDGWLSIGGVFWINYRIDGINLIQYIPSDCVIPNLQFFAEGIENWDMKEDFSDYYNSDPFQFAKHINKTNKLLNDFCKNNAFYYLNLDISSSEGMQKTIMVMDELCNNFNVVI